MGLMADKATIKRYHRQRLVLRLVSLSVFVAYCAGWILYADGAAGAIGSLTRFRWLGLFGFAAVFGAGMELVSAPLSYYAEFAIEHAFGLSHQTRRAWAVEQLKGMCVAAVIGAIVVGGLYASLWYGGPAWWAWVWIGWLALSVGLARLFPVVILPIFYKARAIDRPELRARFEQIAQGTGVGIRGLYDLDLSKDTRKVNAMLAGLGATRRVYLSDTLLSAFTDEEIGVVFAHELGHHVHGHIGKMIALSAVTSTAVVAAVAYVLSPYAGTDPTAWPHAVVAFPAAVLAASLVALVLAPPINAILRRFETQCDQEALQRTRDPEAYRAAFTKLGEINLSDPEPARWVEIMFYDHPALSRRIALADQAPASAAETN